MRAWMAAVLVALAASAAVADGADEWVGKHAVDLLNAPEMEPSLAALVGAEALAEIREVVVVGAEMVVDGEWVAGFGCMAQVCADAYGAVAISARDGRLIVAMRRADGPARLWGELGRALPGAVLQVLAGK
ncbi:hypothetical protein [Phaeovulum sp.]|uniref:hypothetical protein n=1 Tax=Phaeovulum sp. TaxID=2934796 RepID=UPI0035644576